MTLPGLPQLEYLEIWNVRGFSGIDNPEACPKLRLLFLETLSKLTDLGFAARFPRLRSLHLDRCRNLRSIAPAGRIDGLADLQIIDCPVDESEASLLTRMPNLEELFWPLPRDRQRQIRDALPSVRMERTYPGHLRRLAFRAALCSCEGIEGDDLYWFC